MDIFLLYLHSDGFGCPKPNSCFHILRQYTLNPFFLNFRKAKNLVFLFTREIHPYQTPAASCVSLNLQKIFKDLIQDLEYKCTILFLDEIEEEE